MQQEFLIECPYCGEAVDLYIEFDVEGCFVQDCEICCNPWLVDVRTEGSERQVTVTRTDGAD